MNAPCIFAVFSNKIKIQLTAIQKKINKVLQISINFAKNGIFNFSAIYILLPVE